MRVAPYCECGRRIHTPVDDKQDHTLCGSCYRTLLQKMHAARKPPYSRPARSTAEVLAAMHGAPIT